jgi:ubiquinone/menaquinone biosynthesis C-methylase UbiE
MNEHHKEPSEELVLQFEKQEIVLVDFDTTGYVLDIGGGGEGIIGKLKGEKVIAIDSNQRELADAPAGPLKIVMDVRQLNFLDRTFNTVTSFFTLMYIKGTDHNKVFSEIFRTLVPGGRFLIWDAILPKCFYQGKKYVLVSLSVKLPHEVINTGYGVVLLAQEQNLTYYLELSKNAGFKVINHKENDRLFFLELQKPE